MANSVVQYLRGLDLSGVKFQPQKQCDGGDTLEYIPQQFTLYPSIDILSDMCRLQWLKLKNAGLTDDYLPSQLKRLTKLESLSLARNNLTNLNGLQNWPTVLPSLRMLNCRKNKLTNHECIPANLFECPNLQVVDFSCNNLNELPKGIEKATGLLVLNVSQNSIKSVPPELFVQCTDLMLLDLSDNQLESLPAQLRRCSSLQQLILSRNPLRLAQLRAVTALKQLEVLHLSSTERRLDNIPNELDRLERLFELDLSCNSLPKVPEPVLSLRALRKLNLAHNALNDMSNVTGDWPKLEYLNLSHNCLSHLPTGLIRLSNLRKLYVNNNCLTFGGIPSGIGKLQDLEIFDASFNKLENIPESLCRCGRLKRLLLNSNCLLTLPDAIHFLRETLEVFEVDNNPHLHFPPKPDQLKKGAGLAYYNIDFSLDTQWRLVCGKPPSTNEPVHHARDSAARLRRLRRRRGEGTDKDSKCVLEGMQRIAMEKDKLLLQRELEAEEESKKIAAKRWQDQLTKPQLDYSGIFDEDTGAIEGLEAWELDQFYPKRVDDEVLHGHLFNGDCYIFLETKLNQNYVLDWAIYYWIGSKASMDKQTCAAIHAVNLRNLLGAEGRTKREEEGNETHEFLALFGGTLIVLDGARGETGFLHVEDDMVIVKLYRLFGTEKRLKIVSMPLSPYSLDPKFVYLLDANSQLFVWVGKKSRSLIQTKGRLLAEKISIRERRNEASIHIEAESRESNMFWAIITGIWLPPPIPNLIAIAEKNDDNNVDAKPIRQQSNPSAVSAFGFNLAKELPASVKVPTNQPKDFIPIDWELPKPILYDVQMGRGYLELPQIELGLGQLSKRLLDPKHVYILDSGGELFLWIGAKSSKCLRSAGQLLAEQLKGLIPRGRFGGADLRIMADKQNSAKVCPNYDWLTECIDPLPQFCIQGAEPQVFKSQFCDWEEPLAVDFTRTAESVAKRGTDLNAILEKDKLNTDLRALLLPREVPITREEAEQMMNEWNDELVEPPQDSVVGPSSALNQFVMLDSKWVPVDPDWFGQFFNQDSYILIARYFDYDEDEYSDDYPDELEPNRTKTVVYFWQGREASDLNWLTFEFSVRKDMETRLSHNPTDDSRPLKVEFKRVRQQQEEPVLLAHFQRQFIIHQGHYRTRFDPTRTDRVQMYYLRANGNIISTRCVEVIPSAMQLNSCFIYFVKVPVKFFNFTEKSKSDAPAVARIYTWIGNKASNDDKELAECLVKRIFSWMSPEFVIIYEGSEPELFWHAIGGRKKYDTSAEFLEYCRLFRLSNEQGYFCASEKCSDFCQDDLADDDVMLLDTGAQIYLWWGRKTSDVEQKLSFQAAKLYQNQLARMQPGRPRQLKLTVKHAEPHLFRRCFHGWGPFREPKDWSG